jgi:alpha-N-acetylglucosaminidase
MDVGRQVLSNLGQELQRDTRLAFERKDREGFKQSSARFLDLLRDVDRLLETRREYRFGDWLAAARRWGTTDAERNLYDKNASLLVTLWGPEENTWIFDYSWREWSGLIRDFYLQRWARFYQFIDAKLAAGEEYSELKLPQAFGRESWKANDFYRALAQWEKSWVITPKANGSQLPEEDTVTLAVALLEKWRPELTRAYSPERKALLELENRKRMASKQGMKIAWEWSPETVAAAWKEIDIDTGKSIEGEGTYEVVFQYQKGANALSVEWVALTQDGREIARDTHPGWAGNEHRGNVYRLKLDALAFGAKYGLTVRLRGEGGTSSHGIVGVRKVEK